MMRYMWISVSNKGKNVGTILVEGDSIKVIEFGEHEIPDEFKEQANKTPKNVFLTKEEMTKYTELEKWE